MTIRAQLDQPLRQLRFEEFPNVPLNYQDEIPEASPFFVHLKVADPETSVFIKEDELQKIGVCPTIWRAVAEIPEDLQKVIQNASVIAYLLRKSIPVISDLIPSECFSFFLYKNVSFANCVIGRSLCNGVRYLSGKKLGVKGAPGMYFPEIDSSTNVFINLKKTSYLGSGSYGKIRKVLWLTAPQGSPQLVAKKVFTGKCSEQNSLQCIQELLALESFSGKRGIISLISGGVYDHKSVIFLPMYECNLFNYLKNRPFRFTLSEGLNMISQLLEGLSSISEKGIHGDLSPANLLLKRGEKKNIEAVIADFGTFRLYGKETYGLTTVFIAPPEYYAKKEMTSKQDVWAMGLSLYEIFSTDHQQYWYFDQDETELWTSTLAPDWVLQQPTYPQTPPFLLKLINEMLDPRPEHRPSAKEVFESFSLGHSSFTSL